MKGQMPRPPWWIMSTLKHGAWNPTIIARGKRFNSGQCDGCGTRFEAFWQHFDMRRHPKSCKLRQAVALVKGEVA